MSHPVQHESALAALGFEPSSPAHDGWLDPAALAAALDGDAPLLLRAGAPLEPGGEAHASVPADGVWLRVDRQVRAAPLRGAEVRTLAPQRVLLETEIELCCDHVKCEAMRTLAAVKLVCAEETLLFAEAPDGESLAPLAAALARRLDLPPPEGARVGEGAAPHEPPLTAADLAPWALRREGDLFVLRDHGSVGPRAAAPREIAATLVLGAGALAAAWVGFAALRAQAYERLAVAGVIVFVLALACFAMAHIALHSFRYRARSAALLYLCRDRLVVAPWLARSGAVDRKPEGRYGAAVRLAEVERLRVVASSRGHTLRYETAHGAYDVGTLPSEAAARAWCRALVSVEKGVAHADAAAAPARPRLQAAAVSALVLWLGCSPAPDPISLPVPQPAPEPIASVAPVPTPTSVPAPPHAKPALHLVEDDVPRALEEANKAGKALFVEVWAPWCHTCLSMKSFVLPDPAVVALGDRVVFAAVDSDRPDNAAFMGRYEVNVWPTLFVLDPKDGAVLGMWQGAASVAELRRFLTESVDSRDAALDPKGPLAPLMEARRAHAARKFRDAARHYQTALDRGGAGWSRRSEALYGLLFAEYRQGRWSQCVDHGVAHAASIEGAAVPTDFCSILLECAGHVADADQKKRARDAVLERLRRHTDAPPADASVDDRSDALSLYGSTLRASGDDQGARRASERQLALLEEAARQAPNVEAAATFDYARMNAYLALGKGDLAVAMLRERTSQQPTNYEPFARLGQTLLALKRIREALAPLEKAVELSYGPRRLQYLDTTAAAHAALKDAAGERAALERLVAEWEKLDPEQRNERRAKKLAGDAKKRLQALAARG
jgi:thiol-disulfide isomerase/thioredoxin